MRISDWSSDVCSSDLLHGFERPPVAAAVAIGLAAKELRDGKRLAGQGERLDAAGKGLSRAQRAGAAARPGPRDPETFGRVDVRPVAKVPVRFARSEEHTTELQSLMRNSYAAFCLIK